MITLSFDNMPLFACRFQQHYSISVTLLLTGEHHCASHYISMYYLSNVWQSEGGVSPLILMHVFFFLKLFH